MGRGNRETDGPDPALICSNILKSMKHLIALSLLFSCQFHQVRGEAKPMNIVVLLADDWRYNTLGCAGNPVVKTPNLDRLSEEVNKAVLK